MYVWHCLAIKVFIAKLPATEWVEVTGRYTGSEGGHGQTN